MHKYLDKFRNLSSSARLYISVSVLLLASLSIIVYSASLRQEKRTFAESAPVNLIANPGFEADKTPWTFYTNATGSFNTVSPAFAGASSAKITLNTTGNNMQLFQTNISLEPNTKYRLTFSAYSSTGHDAAVYLHKHVSPYTGYGLSYTPNLTTSWQTFTTEFTTSGFGSNVADARLRFYFPGLASAGDVYYFDEMKLEKISAPTNVSTPTFNPLSGTYSSSQSVTISTTTAGAVIHYTTDGSTPIESSPTYASPINISSNTTFKAKAFKTGMTPSSMATAMYTFNSNNGTSVSRGVSHLWNDFSKWNADIDKASSYGVDSIQTQIGSTPGLPKYIAGVKNGSTDYVGAAVNYAHSKNIKFYLLMNISQYANNDWEAFKNSSTAQNQFLSDMAWILQRYPTLDGIEMEEPHAHGTPPDGGTAWRAFNNDFFTRAKSVIAQYKPTDKPDIFMWSFNSASNSTSNVRLIGLDVDYINANRLFNTFHIQNGNSSLSTFQSNITTWKARLPNLRIASHVYLNWSSLVNACKTQYPNWNSPTCWNQAFFDQIKWADSVGHPVRIFVFGRLGMSSTLWPNDKTPGATAGDKVKYIWSASSFPPSLPVFSPTPTNSVSTPTPTIRVSTPTPTPVTGTQIPATPTIKPGGTYFNFDILFHGIGMGGDNQKPKSPGNLKPVHTRRSITVEVYNNLNNLILTKTGEVEFAESSGNFTGSINMGNTLADGAYMIKVKSGKYLRRSIPGIISMHRGKDNTFSQITLVTGDVNNDNSINILDYNLIMGCYSDFNPARKCTDASLADLTDDGSVNQYDYNLFLREIAIQAGA